MSSRLALVVLALAGCCGARHASADDSPRPGVLTLTTDDAVAGMLQHADGPNLLRWQGTGFLTPFDFAYESVGSVQFPATNPPPSLHGQFAVECLNGDLVAGNLVAWDEQAIQLDSPRFGRLHVQPDAVRRIYRLDDNPTIAFPGLAGLLGWRTNGKTWREEGPQIETSDDVSMATADIDLPSLALIEFEIAWKGKPGFVFAFGVDPTEDEDNRQDGWRFEIWGDDLTIVREQALAADVDRVQELNPRIQKTHLFAYLDQNKGSLHVFHAGGTPAGRITVPGDPGHERGRGVRLVNRHGTVRLERLRIARWNGILPTEQAVDQSHYQLADGTAVSGRIIRLTPDRQSFVVRHEDEETTIPAASVMTAELAFHFDGAYGPTTLILQDGSRVSGTLDSTRPGQLIVASPQVAEPLTVPHAEVRSVSIVHPDQQEPAPPTAGRTGRLELGDLRLHGALVPHVETAESHCLAFQPVGSRTSSPLSPDASGRIVYREAKRSKSQEEPRTTVSQPQPGRNFADLFLKKSKEPAPAKLPTAHELHLRSGDVIPCTIVAIDEHGLTIESSVATATHVPHDRVKAAKLAPRVSPPKLDDKKKDRLLTLPRLQKASPPTHLVVSKTGDFLRCRLMGLNETQVRVEVHLDEFDIPRERVTQIIWFHPDELTAETSTHTIPALDLSADDSSAPAQATAANTDDSDAGVGIGLVQAIERSGNRITFDPRQLDGTTLSGVSDVLGDCQVDIGQIDELIFGREIARAVASLDYQDWRLHPAVEPLIASEGDESGTADGAASPLVGQPAPEINLELLAGGRFRLSEHRGKIVLLDFWASWCGPCMQTMPLVEEAVAEFDPTQVMLVAVNLEEPAEHVQGVLQRHNMEMTVALDIDGAAARRYQANAIPQLVIVDRTGKVAKLYIGGGPQVVEQIKSTLQELLTLGDVTTP